MRAIQEGHQRFSRDSDLLLPTDTYVARAHEICREQGIVPLTAKEIVDASEAIHTQLLTGKYSPSGIYRTEKPLLPPGYDALVIEFGGTYIERTLVRVTAEGKEEIVPGTYEKIRFSKQTFDDATEFIREITSVDNPSPLLQHLVKNPCRAVAIVCAQDLDAKLRGTLPGLDATIKLPMAKNYEVPGIDKLLFGKEVMTQIRDIYGEITISEESPLLVTNDANGLLLSGESHAAVILGSGLGGAMFLRGHAINIEPGTLKGFPTPKLVTVLDRGTKSEGIRLTEKQAGGTFVGPFLDATLIKLYEGGGLPYTKKPGVEIEAPLIDQILNGDIDALEQVFDSPRNTIIHTLPALEVPADNMRDRIATIVGTIYGTMVKTYPEEFPIHPDGTVDPISTGGSMFRIPELREKAQEVATWVAEQPVEFAKLGEKLDMLGAANQALSYV